MAITSIELRHLRAFVAVAEELHFTRAAQCLHLAQQALSSQVQQLERNLEVELFVRTTRKVELTEAGQVLLGHAVPLLASLDVAYEQTRRAGTGELGEVAVAYTPTVAPDALPALNECFHASHPTIKLQTVEMWPRESLEAVASGRFDACFIRSRDAGPELESMIVRQEPLGIILGEGHPLARQPAVRIADLGETYMCIWPRSISPGYFDLVNETFKSAGYTGRVHEIENLTSDVFFGDTVARMEIAACRAFSVGFQTQPLSSGFVWRTLDPEPFIPLNVCWRNPTSRATDLFLETVRDVSARREWMNAGPPTNDEDSG